MLDNTYSWLDKSNGIYDYNEVMNSTSHVHMMLSTALLKMIDKTECLMFYDTPNSVKSYGSSDKTESPWIYSEVMFSQISRITIPKRIKTILNENKTFSGLEGVNHFDERPTIKYDLNSKHLTDIPVSKLNEWIKYSSFMKKEEALDILYKIVLSHTKLT